MAEKMYKILDKSTNKSKKRAGSISESSEEGSVSSVPPSPSHDVLTFLDHGDQKVKLREKLSSAGGFTSLLTNEGVREIYGFPTKILSRQERESCVKEFILKLYKINGEEKYRDVDKILLKISPKIECKRPHLLENSHSKNLVQNVEMLPPDGFVQPNAVLALSTPGPRLSKVKNIYSSHSATDSLKVINHLGLSEDDARYVRGISLVGLSTEYSVKQRKSEIMGNDGKGWVVAKKVTIKKWYRKKENEVNNYKHGEPAIKEIALGHIPKENIQQAIQHWAQLISNQGQYIEMQSMEFCPTILNDCVCLILGNDSGQGFTREGVRFCNRTNGNSGWKIFVTTMMKGSDKSLGLFQKQSLFSSLSGLRNLTSIQMGGKERRLVKFSCMDYEAASEDFGHQVLLYILYIIWGSSLRGLRSLYPSLGPPSTLVEIFAADIF